MAVYCSKCDSGCSDVCDFCKYYQFNGEDMNGNPGPIYVDKGCCSLHFLISDPGDGCEYFYCQHADQPNKNGNVYTKGCLKKSVGNRINSFKFNNWQEVTKEQIDNAMLMPGEYKEKDGKFYIKPGMLDGYICDELYQEEINDKEFGHITGVPLITDENKHYFLEDPNFDIKAPEVDWILGGVSDSEHLKRCKEKIREIFDKDEQLKWGYILNIAMHLYDELCKDGVELKVERRNEIAEKLLKVVFYMGEK